MYISKSIKIPKFPVDGDVCNLYIHIIYDENNKVRKILCNVGKGSTMDIADYETIIRLINNLLKKEDLSDICHTLTNIDAGIRYRYGDRTVKSFGDLLSVILTKEIQQQQQV